MKYFVIIIFSFICISSFGQQIGVGASGIYNFQSESYGYGLRLSVFPTNNLSLTPQFSRFPSFNKVDEWTIGLGVEFKIIHFNKFFIYGLGHFGYNSWNNYAESPIKDAVKSNWNTEFGIGISTKHCLRPFVEWRYNIKFMESPVQIGLLYVFNCKSGQNQRTARQGGGRGVFKSKKRGCPAYNDY
jgi:hypothetical protein